jgi:glucose-6-phosphate isomerase
MTGGGPRLADPDPTSVTVDAAGAMSAFTARYDRRLSDLAGMFLDSEAHVAAVHDLGDAVVYTVTEHRQSGCELFFGTTRIAPGTVGGEYFMTRGHFHARPDRGEVYTTLSGTGLLILETRDGRTAELDMSPGRTAAIPPGWAHRTVNTGPTHLVFSWVCSVDAGHDYASIALRGMRRIVLCRGGRPVLSANPRFG